MNPTPQTDTMNDYEQFETLLTALDRANGFEGRNDTIDEMITLMKKEDAVLAKLETSGFAERAKTEREKIRANREELKAMVEDAVREAEREGLKNWITRHQKVNPNLDRGAGMKVLMETQPDGSVELLMPMGVPPDTAGYNRNRAFQKERKTKARAKARAKLEAKHAPHTGEDCDRCFWEK